MNEEMRKEFEEWYEREGKTKPFTTVSIKDKMFDSWKASREALSENHFPDAAKMVALEGWQLVPVEPTIEMVQAATNSAVGFGTRAAYQAMLSAAPNPEGGEA